MLQVMRTIPDALPSSAKRPGGKWARLRRRLIPGSRWSVTDPAEAVEIPVSSRDRFKIAGRPPGPPFRPSRPDDVPPSARAALEVHCGPLPLERLFVVPKTTRLVSPKQCVITPARVLGFGAKDVALWVDDCPGGRVMSIPIDRLIAVDNRSILLYGRLRLLAAGAQLVVRYNSLYRDELQENLRDLRSQMARKEFAVESRFQWLDPRNEQMTQSDLPFRWQAALDYPTVRPNLREPVLIAVGDVAGIRRGRTGPPSGVAVLGSRELVIANEPSDSLDFARYGIDLLAVPRERLDSLSWDGRSLTVHLAADCGGVEGHSSVVLPLDPGLVEAMGRAFGSAVQWI